MELEGVMGEIEAFFAKAAEVDAFSVDYDGGLEPSTDEDIQSLCKAHSVSPPEELTRFWKRGMKYKDVTLKRADDFATAGFDWVGAKLIARDMPILRGLTEHYEVNSPEKPIVDTGIALSYSEPQIIWVPEMGIYHFSGRNSVKPPIASTLTDFLYFWLEAGCFSSHNHVAYLKAVKSILPGRVPLSENPWVNYYRQQFEQFG